MLLSLVLFGSRARGDHRHTSDIDLLGVVETGSVKGEATLTGTSFYRYPLDVLRTKSEEGDLFVLHVMLEGKILYDPSELFADVCKRFRYRNSYDQTIREASGVVWFLLNDTAFAKTPLGRKRLVWGLRTILIARAAEKRAPAFSSSALAKFAENASLGAAIEDRFSIPIHILCDISFVVVSTFGVRRSVLDWPTSRPEQQELLATLGNVSKTVARESQRAREQQDARRANGEPLYV